MKQRDDNLYLRKGIYAIKNKVIDKFYIGQTTYSFGDRRDSHFSLLRTGKHPVKEMQKDFNDVGEENFEYIVLHDLQDGENIDELECQYISEYKAKNMCYNVLEGGRRGYSRIPCSPDVRKHIGELNRIRLTGSKLSEETKKNMSVAHKKRISEMSDEQLKSLKERARKLGKSHKGNKWTEAQRQAMRDEQKLKPRGAKYTVEQIIEIRKLYEKEGYSIKEIADKFNIPKGTIRGIVKYERWKNIS